MTVSEEFSAVFFQVGAYQNECVCGRVHFGEPGHWDWEEGEHEALLAEAKKDPEKKRYVYHRGDDGVRVGDGPNDVPVVEDCPCKTAELIEGFWWKRAVHIAAYLKARGLREGRDLMQKAFLGDDIEKYLAQLAKLEDTAKSRAAAAQKALML